MKVHYSSNKHTWETPQDFFNKLNTLFNFTLDACAEDCTAKVDEYYTEEDNALIQKWDGVVWCNPPYGRQQGKFVHKALEEYNKNDSTIVLLIPARPDTKLWQDMIFPNATQICFVRGRLRFGNSKDNAPFPCALVVFSDNMYDLDSFGYCI